MTKRLTVAEKQDMEFLKEVERGHQEKKKREALRAKGKKEAMARLRKGGV